MSAAAAPSFGVVTLDGVEYIERPQIFGMQQTVQYAGQVITNIPFTLPAVSDFLLKGQTRDTLIFDTAIVPNSWVSMARSFRFKMYGGAQPSPWFFSGGLGVFDDRVVDTNCFGSAQFPYPFVPPIPVPANGSLFIEIEDMNVSPVPGQLVSYPYIIHFAFHGSFLIPTQGRS